MRKALVVAGLLILGFAPSAKAVPVEVTYAVTTVASLPAFGNAPLATMTGQATIRYQNATALGSVIQAGAVRFQSFVVAGTVNLNLGAPLLLTGNIALSLGPIAGNPVNQATNQLINVNSHVNVHFSGTAIGTNLHCLGTLCTAALGVPASVTIPVLPITFSTNAVNANTGGPGQYLGNANLSPLGAAFPGGVPSISLGGNFGTAGGQAIFARSTLTEISRTVVPEPGTASLVWLGLVGIAGARWHRRTRRG